MPTAARARSTHAMQRDVARCKVIISCERRPHADAAAAPTAAAIRYTTATMIEIPLLTHNEQRMMFGVNAKIDDAEPLQPAADDAAADESTTVADWTESTTAPAVASTNADIDDDMLHPHEGAYADAHE